jgi:hypothetical protein
MIKWQDKGIETSKCSQYDCQKYDENVVRSAYLMNISCQVIQLLRKTLSSINLLVMLIFHHLYKD